MRPSRSSAGGAASSARVGGAGATAGWTSLLLAHAASVAGLALPVRPPYPRDVNAEPWPSDASGTIASTSSTVA